MTWQTTMTPILRYLINDVDPTDYTYSDARLQTSILIAGQLISKEVDFNTTYTIDVPNSGLTPDPTVDPADIPFINLTCLKAATIVYGGELRLAAKNSIKIVDGPSQIDVTSQYGNLAKLYQSSVDAYNKAKVDYVAGNSIAGQTVNTPYTYPNSLVPTHMYRNFTW